MDTNLAPESTGSAAIECAFVAAGLLRVARFERPNVWDIAGGIALVEAAGGVAVESEGADWALFEGFAAPAADGREGDIRDWHKQIILGDKDSVALVSDLHRPSTRPA
jgi:myo-inositol-1(or 4)-monophosphatase